MIPMADNMNHTNVEVEKEVLNLNLHIDVANNLEYHRVNKFFNDYSLAFKAHLSEDK